MMSFAREHHYSSGPSSLLSEIIIATAAERTRHLKLGPA